MITATGYSKDPNIMPEAIVVTFGQEMMREQGGMKHFLSFFQEVMTDHETGDYWMHTCSNLPKLNDFSHVYIIVANRLYGRAFVGGFKRDDQVVAFDALAKEKRMDKPFIILSGPFEKCPFKRTLKGFQGFRYCTKLF